SLYATFATYRLGDDFVGCDFCASTERSEKLASIPLRKLTYDDLELYSSKAITTWGNQRHFKHFLPRLLELTIAYRDEFLDLAVVFGKLECAHWDSWPTSEQNAVKDFFSAYWLFQLSIPISGTFEDAADTVLCAFSNACSTIDPFLSTWINTDSTEAHLHLAAFVLQNESSLMKKCELWNAFWNTTAKPHAEVLAWLQSQEVIQYLKSTSPDVLVDDFAFAVPQLFAIQARLANQ
ncbi:MAG: hypothetical protein RID07_00675, partial [Lacipirellulaceae bacterium]